MSDFFSGARDLFVVGFGGEAGAYLLILEKFVGVVLVLGGVWGLSKLAARAAATGRGFNIPQFINLLIALVLTAVVAAGFGVMFGYLTPK